MIKIMKKITAPIIFMVLLGLTTIQLYRTLEWKDNLGIRQFYEYGRNTMDVIAYGSSHSYCTFNPALLWRDYRMAAYNMGESGQNFDNTYYYIRESLKYQTPKVLLVELRGLVVIDEGLHNGNLYRNTLGMKWSGNYLDNMRAGLKNSKVTKEETYDYEKYLFLKFPVFHSRYKELEKLDFKDDRISFGRYDGTWTTEAYDTPKACALKKSVPLSEEQKNRLDQLRNLAEENNVNLIFWVAPYIVTDQQMMQFNALKEYAGSYGIPFFNFNEIYQEIGFDYAADMRKEKHEGSHLNNYGAEKVTRFLGEYLHKNYEIPERTGNKYQLYETIYDNWMQNVREHEKK